MARPFDISKFRSSITKSVPGIAAGFNDPINWISTGNYCLNYLMSGDFQHGVPLGKVVCFAGDSGSGKSYLCSGNIVRNAQAAGVFIVILDSENALDEKWLQAVGVDTSEDKLMRFDVSNVNQVAGVISGFMDMYKEQNDKLAPADQAKVLFVIDSLGMLTTGTEENQFKNADMKGDMGIKAKQLTSLTRNVVSLIAEYQVGVLSTNHTYASQNIFDPDDKISGGNGFVYASSIVVGTRKKKLKDKDLGGTTSEVKGIKAACKVVKSRFSKPFEEVDVYIPYAGGMDPYSGLFELFEKAGILVKAGNRYQYTSKQTGETFLEYRKNIGPEHFDKIMSEVNVADISCKVEVTTQEDDA